MEGRRVIVGAVSFALVLAGISVFYYYVIFLPKHEQVKLDFQKQQEQSRLELQKQEREALEQKQEESSEMLQACLADVDINYSTDWKRNCKSQNLNDDCRLPINLAESIDNNRNESRDFCLKQYPQK
jgi:hypothetical protein